jgi:uncharacterized protein
VKYLIWLLIALVVIWTWRSRSAKSLSDTEDADAPAVEPSNTIEMLVCAHCGVHFPANDVVTGANGRYCGTLHRDQHEN